MTMSRLCPTTFFPSAFEGARVVEGNLHIKLPPHEPREKTMKLSEARKGDRVALKGIVTDDMSSSLDSYYYVRFDGAEETDTIDAEAEVEILERTWRVGDRFVPPDDDEAEFTITAIDADGNALARNKHGVFCAWTAAELKDVERLAA